MQSYGNVSICVSSHSTVFLNLYLVFFSKHILALMKVSKHQM